MYGTSGTRLLRLWRGFFSLLLPFLFSIVLFSLLCPVDDIPTTIQVSILHFDHGLLECRFGILAKPKEGHDILNQVFQELDILHTFLSKVPGDVFFNLSGPIIVGVRISFRSLEPRINFLPILDPKVFNELSKVISHQTP